eukprot:snap_masked-scaffold_34-processed-gene-3.57-mRNA-1 protein AED:1.00 eAED:1.00 QI:0/-1/0/0/-1/1/1/0/95
MKNLANYIGKRNRLKNQKPVKRVIEKELAYKRVNYEIFYVSYLVIKKAGAYPRETNVLSHAKDLHIENRWSYVVLLKCTDGLNEYIWEIESRRFK